MHGEDQANQGEGGRRERRHPVFANEWVGIHRGETIAREAA